MKMENPEKHIYYIKITEDVSDYDPEFKPRADFGVILEDAIMGEYVRVAEDVSQEVEALKAENEQLRKERDDLARIILMVEDGSDLPVDEDEWNYIVKICREAKKVNENGK